LELCETHRPLVDAGDVNIWDESTRLDTIKKTQILLVPSKETGLEVNAEKRIC
jgi:hypothetical protein